MVAFLLQNIQQSRVKSLHIKSFHLFLASKVWRRRKMFGTGAEFHKGGGGVTLRFVCLTQELVTLPKLFIHSWKYEWDLIN